MRGDGNVGQAGSKEITFWGTVWLHLPYAAVNSTAQHNKTRNYSLQKTWIQLSMVWTKYYKTPLCTSQSSFEFVMQSGSDAVEHIKTNRSIHTFSHRCRIHYETSAQAGTTVTRPWLPLRWAASGCASPLCSRSHWCERQLWDTSAQEGGQHSHGRCLSPHCGLDVTVQGETSQVPVGEHLNLSTQRWNAAASEEWTEFEELILGFRF